jgi:hypothetical protein
MTGTGSRLHHPDQAGTRATPTGTAPETPRPFLQAARRRWPALLGVLLAVVIFGDGRPETLTRFAWLLAALPVPYLAFGWARGELRRSGPLALQLGGLVAFTTVAAFVFTLGDDTGRYLLAAGWFAHGIWDLAHHRANRVVPRAWSEWCAVFDFLVAVALAFLPAP